MLYIQKENIPTPENQITTLSLEYEPLELVMEKFSLDLAKKQALIQTRLRPTPKIQDQDQDCQS